MTKMPETANVDDPADEIREEQSQPTERSVQRQDWHAIDLSGQGLRLVAPTLFKYSFLRELYLDHNRLQFISPLIGQLRCLEKLDLSSNFITTIPEEIGMLVNLEQLLLYDNSINDVPFQIGHLYKLEVLGLEGNPVDEVTQKLMDQGTKALVTEIREQISSES